MGNNTHKKLKAQWEKVTPFIEIADVAFIFLRIIILCGGVGWIFFSDLSEEAFGDISNLFVFLFVYSVLIYLWLFLTPENKRRIHILFLIFDFIFISLLVRLTGGFDSHFLNAFYIITALYSFYYGLVPGAVIAAIASVLYLVSGKFELNEHPWPNLSVSIAFMFLLAIPLGMLSQKLKGDKAEITNLNRDLKRYIKELQKVHGRLIQVEKLSELGRLAADVAHEIRNPLTSIGGFARRLDSKLAQIRDEKECIRIIKKEKEYSEIIISEVERLERILRDVLTFSREVKYNLAKHELNRLIRESLGTFKDICVEQNIQVDEKYDASLPEVLIDKDHVKQAIINIISNAIDEMPGGGTLRIRTSAEALNDVNYVAAEVADTGRGIPGEELSMIFEPFYSSKEIGVGTGLGLSICKKIMDENNGLIMVESELSKGTSFKMLFPYQKKEDESKTKCWEFHRCGVEKTEGAEQIKCPAYPNYGRICWAVAGTFCGGEVRGAIARKLGDCELCEFHKMVVEVKDI